MPLTIIVYAAIVAIGLIALPANTDKVAVPATLLWRFRVASAGGQLVLWTTLGLTSGALASRARDKEIASFVME